ncbi:toxin-antitoxin system YwqK family antitoxin [Maribacter sp. IgM3_T14_3]|jgi:antitoxin component YwqK of YwqJK toxin-antitoxin module|uniref:toxin-antitoxin system YwqK family antitoxin n=1 Tax=Maribacter sp. IgM3_T14_3 TaxID=3415140 RepID=UPI003C6F3CFF
MSVQFRSFLFLSLLWIGCSEQKGKISQYGSEDNVELPETIVTKSEITYNHKISLWTLNDRPYSGFAVSYYPDSTLMEKFAILRGKKQNKSIQWYPDGHLKNVTNYHNGKLNGEKKIWSADSLHVLIAQYNFVMGKAHGEQKKWYPDGKLFKKMNLNKGREEGIQQAFRKNGVLYANYEAREGRIFGMKKSVLCYGLEDENIKYTKIDSINF